ncbi:MAG: site-specific integrase [Dechloromonas sp.]|nr:site-specific integrase [Candidatus Dechloromonas phosphoritropha]MBP8786195.1 site-specific integrase [Azonexus sp.]MBP9226625.1 site-specific integrase [Azonexus sp.]
MAYIKRMESKRTGQVTWKAEIHVNGVRDWDTFDTQAEAKAWAADIETQLRKGTYRDTSDAQKKTLADVLTSFRDEEATDRRTKRASKAEIYRIDKLLQYDICKKKLSELKRSDVKSWKETRSKEKNQQGNPLSASTISREIDIFRSCIEYARDEDDGLGIFLHENVFSVGRRRRNKKPVKVKRERIFSKEEKQALLKAIEKCRNPQMRLAFNFAIETALRKAELVALKMEDWLYPEPLLYIERVEDLPDEKTGERVFVDGTKNGRKAYIPLTPPAIEILRSLRKGKKKGEMYFDKLNYNSLSCSWKRVQKRSGVVDFRWHDLRHVAATKAASELHDPHQVMKVARHSNIQQSSEYVHADLIEIAKKRAAAHERRVKEGRLDDPI